MKDDDQPKKVGYGNPPIATRFQKGKGGNPKGRPKKKNLDLDDEILSALQEIIPVTKPDGTRLKITKLQAIAMKLVNQALLGDRHAIKRISEIVASKEAAIGDELLNVTIINGVKFID